MHGHTHWQLLGCCLTKSGDIFRFRELHGIRPLVFGTKVNDLGETVRALASETVALDFFGYDIVGEIAPGEAIFIKQDGTIQRKVFKRRSSSPCMFEWVYFARVSQTLLEPQFTMPDSTWVACLQSKSKP